MLPRRAWQLHRMPSLQGLSSANRANFNGLIENDGNVGSSAFRACLVHGEWRISHLLATHNSPLTLNCRNFVAQRVFMPTMSPICLVKKPADLKPAVDCTSSNP